MITISLRVATPENAILGFINNYRELRYVLRGDGKIAACEFTVPNSYYDWFNPDNTDFRITIWRSVNNQISLLDGQTEYLTAVFKITNTHITVTAYSLPELLRRRINAYPANNTTYSKFTSAYTGNIMKALVRTNMTASFNALRDGDDSYVVVPNLTVDADANDGVVTTISCSRNNVYDTVLTLAANSQQAGSWLVGTIISNGSSWTFKTFATSFGVNRTGEQALSMDNRNIEQIDLTYDFGDEVNFAIAAGAGTDTARKIGTASGTSITRSIYARRESLYSNPQLRTQNEVDAAATAVVRISRPAFSFKCSLLQTPDFIRGVNYDIGDILNVLFMGRIYTTRLDVIEVSIDSSGINEKAELRLV
jgi:hypothetical protein